MAQLKLNMQENLIARLKERDQAAQFEVYQLYVKAMFNTALRILQDEAEAEDVLQEAFLAAFTKIDRYQGTATFGAWLKRIVVNKSLNALAKRKMSFVNVDDVSIEDVADNHLGDAPPIWNIDQINRAISMLPDGYRVVFSLYLLEGYNHREIAQVLNISEGGSKSQYNRAKKKLQTILTTQSYV